MLSPSIHRLLPAILGILALGAALGASIGVIASAGAATSQKVDSGVCLTTGGGKFVGIPRFPGEQIDRRLKNDVRHLVRKYKIFVTDGYSTDPVHSSKGEHPVGLGLDIVPNASRGGTWADIDRLARWAEPKQNQPRPPFRWVGYDGDSGHGRGHHLHLSWNWVGKHRFGKPMRSVYTLRCPGKKAKPPAPTPAPSPQPAPTPKDPTPPKPPAPKPPPKTGGLASGDSSTSKGGKGKKGSGRKGKRGGRKGKRGGDKRGSGKRQQDVRSGGLAPQNRVATSSGSAGGITANEWARATRGAVHERSGANR